MPASDPASRGPRRNVRRLKDSPEDQPTRQVLPSEVMTGQELLELLDALVEEGYALSIGRTRDGGSLALGFLMGGKPVKKYTPTREAWQDLLTSLSD